MQAAITNAYNPVKTLRQSPVGKPAVITGYGKLPPTIRQHLQAYGLLPGRAIRVLAQQPLTIILIEQTEIALEGCVAQQIWTE